METPPSETSVESHDKGRDSPPRQPEPRRRFRIIKLEERIAPGNGHGNGTNQPLGCHYTQPAHCI